MVGLSASAAASERTRLLTPSRLVDLPLVFLAAHIALGPVFAQWSAVSTVHAYVTVAITMTWAAFGRKLERVVAGAGYVAMCDVLWRGAHARFFHEGAKYVVTAVLLLAMVRFVRTRRRALLPLAYLALLLPSALLTVDASGLAGGREPLSFNLSGPLTLAVSAVFFLQIRCSWRELRHVFVIMLGPITALASAATYIILTEDIVFATESTRLASVGRFARGFGPNQVSAVLGLGALICLLLLLRERRSLARPIELVLGLWFFGTCVLTFSRGGAFNFVVAGGVAVLLQLARGRGHAKTLAILGVAVVAGVVVFSRLDTFTGGALERRFAERSTTGRTEIAETDLDIWAGHRLAGVGPGRSPEFRSGELEEDVTHTEFTRALAEHGMLGLLAMVGLLAVAGRAVIAAPNSWSRTVTIALMLWAVADMAHTAMRLAAPGFVFGLAMARVISMTTAGPEQPST
ncbi:MAG: O-antigen ligase family protein [Acidimicrobiia bacterium]